MASLYQIHCFQHKKNKKTLYCQKEMLPKNNEISTHDKM